MRRCTAPCSPTSSSKVSPSALSAPRTAPTSTASSASSRIAPHRRSAAAASRPGSPWRARCRIARMSWTNSMSKAVAACVPRAFAAKNGTWHHFSHSFRAMLRRVNAIAGRTMRGPMTDPHPYARLTPDVVLNALESLGLRCDGRLLALNSYENRVYQVGLDETQPARFVVAKFYRPARWSEAAIAEEHELAATLAAAEIPVIAPLAFDGATLFHHGGFRFAVYPRRGGRAPELEDAATLEWLGRFIARIHAVGATRRFKHRPRLDIQRFGTEP